MILKKTIKIVATRCQILRLNCTKFDFGWGSAPDPAGEAYSAPPDPLAGFKGPTSKGRKGKEGVGEKEREGGERGRERRCVYCSGGLAPLPCIHLLTYLLFRIAITVRPM